MATAADETRVPPAATQQVSYSGTPRGAQGDTLPDDYVRDLGDPVRRMEKFEEMGSSDDAVRAAIDARRQEINAANWTLSSEDKTPAGVEVLEFVEDNLYPYLDDLLRWLGGGGMQYGFGCIEPVYAWADRPFNNAINRGTLRRPTRRLGGRRIYLRKLAHILPTSITTFGISTTGDLQRVTQQVFNGESFRRVDVPPEKLLLWTYNRQGDDYWGVPPTRQCYKAWTFKTQIERLNLLHIDKFGVGTVAIEEGEGWGAQDRTNALAFAKAWRAGGENAILYGKGGKIEVISDDGKTTMSSLEWVRYYNLQISKVFLTQGSELGSTETGARALGEVFFEQLGGIVQADCEDLASLINNRLIVPLVNWNFGPQEHYPTFAPSQRVKAGGGVATMLTQLMASKAVKPRPEDEAWLRDLFGMPSVELKTLQEEAGAPPAGDSATDSAADPAATPTPAGDPAQGIGNDQHIQVTEAAVLNGAQISSAKDIVMAVVAGELPRDTGVAMLQVFFNLTPEKADQIVGSAGTKTPTTPNPVAGGTPAPAAPTPPPADAPQNDVAEPPAALRAMRALSRPMADGAPPAAERGVTTYRTREYSEWEQKIVRPDVLERDLDLHAARLTSEVQDVLKAIDADLAAQAEAHATDSAETLAAAVRTIAVPERLRKQLRKVLLDAAERARDYGREAVQLEIERQVAPDGVGPQRTAWLGYPEPGAYSLLGRITRAIRALAAGDEPTSTEKARELRLAAQVDHAVESEIDRREQSTRSAMLTALAQAGAAATSVLASVVVTAVKSALVGLSTGRTQDAVASVVNVGFGAGRSDAADAIQKATGAASAPASGGGGGDIRSGLRDADGNPIGLVAKVYSAVMDLGTCDQCAKWDGAEFPIDYPEDLTGVQAPNPRCEGTEQRCRCVWIYITDRESVPLVPASKGPEPIRAKDVPFPAYSARRSGDRA
jgi:hypothetical protein